MSKENQDSNSKVNIVEQSQGGKVSFSEQGIQIKCDGSPVKEERLKEESYVYLLLDCSSSMSGNPLEQAKEGVMNFARESLKKGYLFGLISFNTSASHIFSPREDITALGRQMEKITSSGTTNMTSAIKMAISKLGVKEGNKVIVIATDGQPNNSSSALQAGQKAISRGIDIIMVGTASADESFLNKISSRNDLAVKVSRSNYQKGITSAARLLPKRRR